ncbi:MAG: peptide chain release factor 2 [Deltaproteobacteria bacterium]|nr:peptide chain release factor 2 [Deltaproteobacteria bacterium]
MIPDCKLCGVRIAARSLWQHCKNRWKPSNHGCSSCGGYFDLARKEDRIRAIDNESSDPNFWNDAERAQKMQQERARCEADLQTFAALKKKIDDALELLPLAKEDPSEMPAIEAMAKDAEAGVAKMEFARMLSGELDGNNAIVAINAGSGGTESQDWASMLLRMYKRWAERRGFTVEMVDYQSGDEAGIKSASFFVRGQYAYGYLKAETGVHRLVRISPFDSNARRHTSFSSVFISPEIDDDIEIDLNEGDIRMDTYRAGGSGGQHVNKTDSAVRLTHIPTGTVVASQAERSQHKNRSTAMKMLRAKLYELEMQKRQAEQDRINSTKKAIAWGSQIRSYVLQPYRLVKDHRTAFQSGNTDAVLDGDLDGFMEAFLLAQGGKGFVHDGDSADLDV